MGENSSDLPTRENHRRTEPGVAVGWLVDGELLNAENLFGEEGHGIEGLLPGGSSDVAFQRQRVAHERARRACDRMSTWTWHALKSARQDAAHSRRDAGAPHGITFRQDGWSGRGHRRGRWWRRRNDRHGPWSRPRPTLEEIRDRKVSASTRIPRKMAVNGAQTRVSNQTCDRNGPDEYTAWSGIGPAGPGVADREGFEPSVSLHPHTLSKRAH
jgi:hypothetical protein